MPNFIRIQRRRTKGYDMQAESLATNGLSAVYVGRPTKWGNLWEVGLARCGCRSAGECSHNIFRTETAADAVSEYRLWITEGKIRKTMLGELRGKNLACWCALDQPCHADVLLELANA